MTKARRIGSKRWRSLTRGAGEHGTLHRIRDESRGRLPLFREAVYANRQLCGNCGNWRVLWHTVRTERPLKVTSRHFGKTDQCLLLEKADIDALGSITRVIAGCFRFFTFSLRPARLIRPVAALRHQALQPHAAGGAKQVMRRRSMSDMASSGQRSPLKT